MCHFLKKIKLNLFFPRPILFQSLSSIRSFFFDDITSLAGEHEPSPAISSLWTNIDAVVRVGDDIEIVLNDEDTIPLLDESVEDGEEFLDIREVEPG